MKNYCEYFGLKDGRIVCFKKGIGRHALKPTCATLCVGLALRSGSTIAELADVFQC